MILFLTQKAISDLKELWSKNIMAQVSQQVYPNAGADADAGKPLTDEAKVKQVKQLASNAYELCDTLEQMKMSRTDKDRHNKEVAEQLREEIKLVMKRMGSS